MWGFKLPGQSLVKKAEDFFFDLKDSLVSQNFKVNVSKPHTMFGLLMAEISIC